LALVVTIPYSFVSDLHKSETGNPTYTTGYIVCVYICVCMCATGCVTVCVCMRSYMRVNACVLIIESNSTWRTVSKTRSRRAFWTNFYWYKNLLQADTLRHTRFACRRRHQMFKTVYVEIRVNYQMINARLHISKHICTFRKVRVLRERARTRQRASHLFIILLEHSLLTL